jgi:hypothetical protein
VNPCISIERKVEAHTMSLLEKIGVKKNVTISIDRGRE